MYGGKFRYIVFQLMGLGCTICTVMFGNGVPMIGMITIMVRPMMAVLGWNTI